jgi:hypothetical protein
MNGQTFSNLDNLKKVVLIGNECINENFVGMKEIENLSHVVSQKCGFCETEVSTDVTICKISYQIDEIKKSSSSEVCKDVLESLKQQSNMLATFMNETVKDLKSQIAERDEKIRKLEHRVKELKNF